MNDIWTDRLSDYLDDGMSADERAALEAHLAECAGCARTLDELRAVVGRLQRLGAPAPAADPWPAIAAQIGARRAEVIPIDAARRRRPYRQLLQSAAAAAAVLVVGIGIGRGTLGPRVDAPIATAPTETVGAPNRLAYHAAAVQHLSQTEVLLTTVRAAAATGEVDERLSAWARELLTTTRLMLDSPLGDDAQKRALLQDLELVLAQIVQLPGEPSGQGLELLNQQLNQGSVLPRLRVAIPAGTPVTAL